MALGVNEKEWTVLSNRIHHIDQTFQIDVSNAKYDNRLFQRIIAKGRLFKDVDFKYTIFDACYFRNCVFDSCDFTGCKFSGTNLIGSTFTGCKFEYAIFERTLVDNDILDVGCPGYENLKLKFARTLRTNYQALGDSESANKAIALELKAKGIHLYKAWRESESYYRNKYKGFRRIKVFFEWLNFKTLDWVWGNGESVFKLIRSVFVILIVMCLVDIFLLKNRDYTKVPDYFKSFVTVSHVYFGNVPTKQPNNLNAYPNWFITLSSIFRLISFGFFMSILIKRFNRR